MALYVFNLRLKRRHCIVIGHKRAQNKRQIWFNACYLCVYIFVADNARLQLCNLSHATDCTELYANGAIVTSQMNHCMMWTGWQQEWKQSYSLCNILKKRKAYDKKEHVNQPPRFALKVAPYFISTEVSTTCYRPEGFVTQPARN